MAEVTLQQACSPADKVLSPPQEYFSDASGTPCQPNATLRQPNEPIHRNILSSLQELDHRVSELLQAGTLRPVAPPETNPLRSRAFIQEISKDDAALAERDLLQEQLVLKSCLVAALYGADSMLLTPWTSHQLESASSNLLQRLSAVAASLQSFPEADPKQAGLPNLDFMLLMMPAILSHLQPCFMKDTDWQGQLELPNQQGVHQKSDK